MKSVSHTFINLVATGLTGLFLLARAWLEAETDWLSPINFIRILFPALLVLGSAILLIMLSVKKEKAQENRQRIKSQLTALIVLITALGLGLVDIAKLIPPYIILPGLAVFGSISWNKPKILAGGLIASMTILGLSMHFWYGPFGFEAASLLLTCLAITLFGAVTVRRNLAPTEARLKSLEAENQTLWDLSYRDSLTGLFNRRYAQQSAQHMFARAVRYHEQLHVLMLDIDHFKKVNDKLGHAVGDEVLKTVAATTQTFIRSSDSVARYGGEEFIIYIVQATPELVQFIANRIRDGVAAIKLEAVPWQITISIGVAGLQENDTLDTLIERADKFLYASKHQGRNRVSGF